MSVAAKGLDASVESSGEAERREQHRWRRLRLGPDYRAAVDALERYLVHRRALASGDLVTNLVLDDLADVFEQCEADGVDVRAIVGEDPVEFAELLLANHVDGDWIATERSRLLHTIDAIVSGAYSSSE